MGAAGPLAGFVVAVVAIALGLPQTLEHDAPQLLWDPALLDAFARPIEQTAMDEMLCEAHEALWPGRGWP